MSEGSGEPRRFRVLAEHIQVRVPNKYGMGFGGRPSAWIFSASRRGAILTEGDVHPDDLAHLLRSERPRTLHGGVGPMLEEIPAAGQAATP